jgi:hypothetical protein
MRMHTIEVAPAAEARVIDLVCQEIDKARESVTTEASWERLEQHFYEALLGRHTLSAAAVLAWADAGHPAADRAVRRYGAEMLDQYREGELLAQVRGQIVKILLRPFVPFPQGRHVVANMMRDVWLPALVQRVADGTGLKPTRSNSTATPSAAFFVAKALRKRDLKMSERRLNRIYWGRDSLSADLEASMPPVAPSAIK